jgi:hypothetical protein
LTKRPRAESPLLKALLSDSPTENDAFSSEFRRKRPRKALQLPQFDIYQDSNSTADSFNACGSEYLTLDSIGRQTGKIWPHISVEIPFQPEFHQYSSESSSINANREPLALLLSIALNGAQKAAKFRQNWLKNQLNDYTCTYIYLFFVLFSFLLYI